MSKIIIEHEGTDEMKILVKGALENEIKIIAIGLKKTDENIQEFEGKYKMDSRTFNKKYSSGEIGDDIEYIKWSGELETLRRLQENLKTLSEAKVAD